VNPSCLQNLYGLPATKATQSNNVLAVPRFLNEYANKEYLKAFAAYLRPDMNSPLTFTEQFVSGGQSLQDLSRAGCEANLDIQYTVGLATGVPTVFISSGKSNLEAFDILVRSLLRQPIPPTVLSLSYGFNEDAVAPPRASLNLAPGSPRAASPTSFPRRSTKPPP